ncbi:rhomboid family intramembrane serine protease [Actinomycetospora sp. TBRC 11914]|uniref:rhomboid family intramembrane serine protease n=1 Tax=Actinomycetospora sp. TBRC 11914 TaxID=2729387 RepID=UPI00145C904C|nr:rhomboid family intramembrane serine protease [Actinomycetospora sp. TBRC 11914]NMO90187.1 rhomboid family intramembrane serine protease [Actinomycetospora sp. TBRC 11914]
MSVPAGGPPQAQTHVCVRHPDRPTGLRCTRCDRPACPECLREASVGMQCVDCVSAGARSTPRARTARRSDTPVVVPTLIAINVAVFVLTAVNAGSVGDNASGSVFAAAALAPVQVAGGGWWRLVTSGFLHIGPLHLVFNMIALWFLGRDVELVLGRLRFSVLYGASLLGGSAAVMLFGSPGGEVAGASGAIFGLMGALVVLLRRLQLPMTQALIVIAVNVVLSLTIPGISLLGHLGGLVVGAAVAAGMVHGPARSRPAAGLVVAGGIVVLLLVAIVLRDVSFGPIVCDTATSCRRGA